MRVLARLAVWAGLGCWTSVGVAHAAPKTPPGPAEGKVGVVTRDYTPAQRRNWRGAETHALHVVIWYPAADTAIETPQVVGPPNAPLAIAGSAMPHASFAPSLEPFPLILLSHGAGDSAEQIGWLGIALARAGFMTAAVEHPGEDGTGATTAEGSTLWWERATDLSEMLDGLLADPELGSHLDRERVGAAGVSLGGYTVLELGGARTDISAFFDMCRQGADKAVCHTPEMRTLGTPQQILESVRKTSGESLARSGDSFRDLRVKAVFAIAPTLGFTLTPESLRGMRLPVEMVAGAADAIAPAAENANYVRGYVRGARLTVLPGAGHPTFLDTCTAAGKLAAPQRCQDEPGVDRDAVHRQIDGMAVQFFARALRLR